MTGWQFVRAAGGVRVEPLAPPDNDAPHVTMLAAGLCGTDVQIAAGVRTDVARVLGHEGVGALRIAGDHDRIVVFNPVDGRRPDSILGHSFDGVFRSWVPIGDEVPVAALHEVAPPPLEPVALLTLCEPLATVIYSWELIGASTGARTVGVWGAGPIGVMQAATAVETGYDVTVVHPSASRRRWMAGQPCGAGVRCVSAAREIGRRVDVAVVCVPRPAMASAVRDAADALSPGGTMVLVPALDERGAALTFTDPTVGSVRWRNQCGRVDGERGTVIAQTREGKRLLVTGHRGTSLAQLGAAERRLRDDPGLFGSLITHRLGPHEAAELINARCAGRSRDDRGAEIVKLVIDFSSGHG